LLDRGAKVDTEGQDNSTALIVAAQNGHLGVCGLLLDRGANVNTVCERIGTALHLAACNGHLSVVKLLVLRGANVRLKDGYGDTAVSEARRCGSTAVADWLDSVSRV
jgi:ankyrin repeat protein